MGKDIDLMAAEDRQRESHVSVGVDTERIESQEKRTRFSLSHDDGSIGQCILKVMDYFK